MRINIVSESEVSVRGHGVHTAYLELTNALQDKDDCDVVVNQFLKPVKADVIHIHTIGLPSLIKLLFGSGKKVISAHVVPASLLGSIAGAHVWLPVARAYMKFFYRRGDKVLAVSKMVAKILEKDLGVDPDKIAVLYNTIDTSNYHTTLSDKKIAREKLGIKANDFVVVGNGQIQPRKRFDSFVSMARRLSDTRFIWVGGIPFKNAGADYKKMQRLINNIPANLQVTGVIELDQVKVYLQAADIFVLPAEQENHPMAVIEAAAAGLPIVLRDIPEYNDTFANDFLRSDSDNAFVDAIKKLKDDKKTYAKYKKGAEAIAKRFDSKTGAEKLINIYEELLA